MSDFLIERRETQRSLVAGKSSGGLPFIGPASARDRSAGSYRYYRAWTWTDTETIEAALGGRVRFTVTNVNILGATIFIESNRDGTRSSLLIPYVPAVFLFQSPDPSPVDWTFRISTQSDAFVVNYKIESDWVPGKEKLR